MVGGIWNGKLRDGKIGNGKLRVRNIGNGKSEVRNRRNFVSRRTYSESNGKDK